MADNGFEEWGGYMEAKITKLEEQFSAASDPFRRSQLFAGISIYVNGLTDPSADELKRLMMVHGGTFHHYERAHTTYIIAANLPDVKVRNMNTSKIISAQWVVDCLREKRILDYSNYLLYTNQKSTQPRLMFGKKKQLQAQEMDSAAAPAKDVATIMEELQQLNTKMRDSLTPSTSSSCANSNTASQLLVEQKYQPPVAIVAAEQKPPQAATAASGGGLARTAVDPKFLGEFYNNSRLHHIATLGAGFKQYISQLREQHVVASGFPARQQFLERLLVAGVARIESGGGGDVGASRGAASASVMHIDMDCFFVSVGLRKHPHLRGQPVAVTHSKGGSAATEVPVHPGADREKEMELFAQRFEQHLHSNILSDKVRNGFDAKMSLSEIASCSYEARAKGLRNGMFVGHAIKLCPDLKTIPYDFDGYKEVAFTLYDTVAQYTLNIEAVSCDEMFIDLTDVLAELQVAPMDFVRAIREEVRQRTGCPCSAGVGANKLQARIATKRAKPDGQFRLEVTDVEVYMSEIPIQELPGVGSSTAYTLKEAALLTCGDLQRVSLAKVQMLVGKKLGETLHQFCRGIDTRGLVFEQVRKSVSAEVNYGIRFKEHAELETFLRQLCVEVHTRLGEIKRKTKCITLKLMVRAKDAPVETSKFMGHGVCDNVTKSVSLSEFTSDLQIITRTILATMKALALPPNELRGIGIQLSKLDDPNEGKERKENVIKNMFSKVVEKQKEIKIAAKPATNSLDEKITTQAEINQSIARSATTTEQPFTAPKQPAKKARGRPPSNSNAKEAKKRPNVMGMLQNAAAKKTLPLSATTADAIPADVDPDVFAALPADIRAEIIREHARSVPPAESKTSNISALNESDLLPSTSKAAKEKQIRKQQQRKTQNQTPQEPLQVDVEFLEALPPDLRAEIEMQIRQQREKHNAAEQSYRPVTPPPPSLSAPAAAHNESKTIAGISVDNIFVQQSCIEILLDWVNSSDVPENYDVELIGGHARELVRAKEIDKLYQPLLYLCRLINCQKGSETDCAWHLAFKMIIDAVQLEMREVYNGRKLFMGAKLKCDKCAV